MSGPVAGVAYDFDITLLEFATGGIMTAPPIVAGDFVLVKDEGSEVNLTTLPVATGRTVKVSLSGAELATVSRVQILAHDPDGIWGDGSWSFPVEPLSIEAALGTLTTRVPGVIQPQTGDTYALANGASGFAAIKAVVDAISTTIGAAGAGLTATATAVWAVATRLLTAGTNIVLAKGVGVTGFTDVTAAQVADAVWDETLADHLTAGSTGAGLNAAGSAGDPWSTALPGAYGAGSAGKILGDNLNATVGSRSTQTSVDDLPTTAELTTALGTADDAVLAAIATVQADTDNLQTRLPAALVSGRIDASIGAMAANTLTAAALAADAVAEIQAGLTSLDAAGVRAAVGLATANLDTQLGDLPTNAELATALGTADDAVLAVLVTVNATLATIAGYLDTEVAAILAKVTALPSDPADASDVAAAVAALSATLVLIKAKTDSLTFTVPTVIDANVQRINDVVITGDGDAAPFGV